MKCQDLKGPWTDIASKIKVELQDTAAKNQKIEQLDEKIKTQAKQYLLLKKDKEEQVLMKASVEKKLGDISIVAE
jgi:hypothetical protein